jgi:hypothetical protein
VIVAVIMVVIVVVVVAVIVIRGGRLMALPAGTVNVAPGGMSQVHSPSRSKVRAGSWNSAPASVRATRMSGSPAGTGASSARERGATRPTSTSPPVPLARR